MLSSLYLNPRMDELCQSNSLNARKSGQAPNHNEVVVQSNGTSGIPWTATSSEGSLPDDCGKSICSSSSEDDLIDINIDEEHFMCEINGQTYDRRQSAKSQRKKRNGNFPSAKRPKMVNKSESLDDVIDISIDEDHFMCEITPNGRKSGQAPNHNEAVVQSNGSIVIPCTPTSSEGSLPDECGKSICSSSSEDDLIDINIDEEHFMCEINGQTYDRKRSARNTRQKRNGSFPSVKQAKIVTNCESLPEPMTYIDFPPSIFISKKRSKSQVIISHHKLDAQLQRFAHLLELPIDRLPDAAHFKQQLDNLPSELVVKLYKFYLSHTVVRIKYFNCFIEYFAGMKDYQLILKTIDAINDFHMARELVEVAYGLKAAGMSYVRAVYEICKRFKGRDQKSLSVLYQIITSRSNHHAEWFTQQIHAIAVGLEYKFAAVEIDRLLEASINSAEQLIPSLEESQAKETGRYLNSKKHDALFNTVMDIITHLETQVFEKVDVTLIKNFVEIYYCQNKDNEYWRSRNKAN